METNKKKIEINVFAIVLAVVLVAYTLTMVLPLFWTLMTTTKSNTEYLYFEKDGAIVGNALWLPKMGATLKNYETAYKHFYVLVEDVGPNKLSFSYNIFQQFTNSILYSVGCAAAVTLSSLIIGYAAARFNYKFSGILYAFVLVTMALPIVGSMPSEIAVAQALGIFDTFPGIWIMRGSFLNTYFLIFYAQFKMIPKDYTEAAKIDGANPFTIMTQIIVPLATGTISTVFVLAFIFYWNDFQIPMVYLPSHPVAAYGMYHFQNTSINEVANVPTKLAGICLMAFPIVIFYAIFNKKLNVNLSVGGIKG